MEKSKYIIVDGELRHYGVMGMKWGRSKGLGSTPRVMMPKMITKKRQLEADKKVLNNMNNKGHHVSIGLTKNRQEAFDKRDKAILEKRIAKNENKLRSKNENIALKKAAVVNYKKEYDKAEKLSNEADKQWAVAKEAYKKTGKNRIDALVNNIKNKSPEVKSYNKLFDKASNMDDRANEQWSKARDAYKKTGKTRITAIINNFKYQ